MSYAEEQQQAEQLERPTSILLEVSNAIVGLYKELFGRGPTKARTFWCGPDAITCVLENTLAPAERSLVEMGEHQRLRETRMFFQFATVREFCEPIERLTGRKVRSFHSSTDTEVEGLSIEMFILHPKDYDGPSRADLTERDELA
jgi:uncharacterized protein YbcI